MDHQVMDISPVLMISGTGRSGTNILKSILSEADEVAALPFEHRFTVDPRGVVDFYNSYPNAWSPFWPEYKVKDFIEFLLHLSEKSEADKQVLQAARDKDPMGMRTTHPPYGGWELERWMPGYTKAVGRLKNDLIAFTYPGAWPGNKAGVEDHEMWFVPHLTKKQLLPILQTFIDTTTKAVLEKRGKKLFVEDNTHSILFAADLQDLCPNSKLVHVKRNPLDVLASARKQRWTPSSVEHLIVWYNEMMKRWIDQRSQCDAQRILEVNFEDLILQKEETLSKICAFANIELNDRMSSFDLSQHNMNRYKTEFTSEEVARIQAETKAFYQA